MRERVYATDLPPDTLLYRLRQAGYFTDCFTTVVPKAVTLPQFVEAFFTTPLFKAERLVLRLLLRQRTTDRQAYELAHGTRTAFAVWRLVARTDHEILLSDESGRTSSWLMIREDAEGANRATRLLFGSAIKPTAQSTSGAPQLSPMFRAILGLHTVYSIKLLQAAATRLMD
jgi:hypothetical protein